jgi:molybdopterin converting factor small subunit
VPQVFLTPLLAHLAGGHTAVEVPGGTVRQVIDNLEARFPGARDALVENNRLRKNVAVAVDGVVGPLGLLEDVGEHSEVHFVPAVSGGRPDDAGVSIAGIDVGHSPVPTSG